MINCMLLKKLNKISVLKINMMTVNIKFISKYKLIICGLKNFNLN